MIFEASTSFASTCLSAAERADRSARMSVGANRAAIFCSLAVSDTAPPCPRTVTAHTAVISTAARIDDMEDNSTFRLTLGSFGVLGLGIGVRPVTLRLKKLRRHKPDQFAGNAMRTRNAQMSA